MTLGAGEFWTAAKAYRSAPNEDVKHAARVALLGLALNDGPIGRRAEKVLREDGLGIIRPVVALSVQAI